MTDVSTAAVPTTAFPTLTPQANETGQYSFLNAPMNSQYYQAFQDSLFTGNVGLGMPGVGLMPGMGMGMGMPMMSMGFGSYNNQEYLNQYINNMNTMMNAQMDLQTNMADRQTRLTFDQRGNQNVLGSAAVSLQGNLTRLKAYIQNNDMRQACDLYKQILKDMQASVGEEYGANSDRIGNITKALQNQIESYYQQINGTSLAADINENGDSSCWSMIKSWFGSKQPSAKEAMSYMTGDAQQYEWYEKLFRGLTNGNSRSELTHTTSY